jgi:hypothetical protein
MLKQPSKIFQTPAIERSFRKNGYVVIPLFPDQAVQTLTALFDQFVQESLPDILYTSHNRNRLDTNLLVSESIIAATWSHVQKQLTNIRPFLGHFISKSARNEYEFALHQDWSITDESRYAVAHVWIPLQDTRPENGGMYVVPGSHRFFFNARSGSLGIPRVSRQDGFEEILQALDVKAGEALIYHPALFHGSYPNKSREDRKVVLLSIVEEQAPALYYHQDQEGGCVNIVTISPEVLLEQLPILEKGSAPLSCPIYQTSTLSSLNNNDISLADLKKMPKKFSVKRIFLSLRDWFFFQ